MENTTTDWDIEIVEGLFAFEVRNLKKMFRPREKRKCLDKDDTSKRGEDNINVWLYINWEEINMEEHEDNGFQLWYRSSFDKREVEGGG